MGEAFGWIADLIGWFTQWVPRIHLIRRNYGGVKFVYGSKVKEMRPGLHVYWPAVTEIEEIPTARQTQSLESQVLMTKDYECVTVEGIIVYTIYDVTRALSMNWDINDTIGDISMTSIVQSVTSRELTDLLSELTQEVTQEITKRCKDDLLEYGVKIHSAALVSCSRCTVINNVGTAITAYPVEQEE